MLSKQIPRLIVTGTNSGAGKTTITCALLQALVNRKRAVSTFKCGPDYIDPMFHSNIIGAKSSNLDAFFFDENTLNYLLAENATDSDISIIEGVMGFYDGLGITSTSASTYELAKTTKSPVVMVVGARGAALSVLAVIEGFINFMPNHLIAGVILNQCSAMTYKILAKAIEERFNGQIKPLGFLPKLNDCIIESRHLGLVTANEIKNLKEKMQLLASKAEAYIDLDALIALANSAPAINYTAIDTARYPKAVNIAVAMDRAFCFYYQDSLDLLKKMGARLTYFSPLTDATLPPDIDGLYLGGGYPELYAKELSENVTMLHSIKTALENKIPCIAECGGFMYLTEKIADMPMVGFIKGSSYDTGKLVRFGYVTAEAKKPHMLGAKGDCIKAHEFHHWDSEISGSDYTMTKASGKSWDAVIAKDHLYAGYPHFHFYSNLKFAENFYETCINYKSRR